MGYILDLQDENEGDCICPYCGCELTNVDMGSLVFMCPDCGEYIEFARDNKPITQNINIDHEDK